MATKAVVMKTAITLMIARICTITKGALRLTAPIEPPMLTLSVVTARKVSRTKMAVEIQTIG